MKCVQCASTRPWVPAPSVPLVRDAVYLVRVTGASEAFGFCADHARERDDAGDIAVGRAIRITRSA